MALDVDGIIAQLKDASILELNDLVKSIEDEFGAGADAAAAKDTYDVELTEAGQEKVKVIKAVREITGLGLKDAKGMVDAAPKVIKEGLSEDDANKLKEQLEGVGATVTLK